MKFTQFTLAAAALLATAAAQGLDSLPDCSRSCATSSIPASCGLNIQCICADKSFLSSIACCVADKCSQADQETTLQVAKGICSRGGVTDLPSTISCTSSSGSSSATGTAATASGTTTGSTSETTTGSAQSTASKTTLSGSVTTTETSASTTGSAASSAASSASSAASSAAATTGAAILGHTRDSSLMAAAGAAAAFAILV
ncbi:putative CFEM domain protein [Penicillium brasilianum]|uniref:Putative CFEM domain protein n=1 Tax=Penicillium brasilianum TaxID=104259 RepID=A0A1S9REQ2_PENBI|nr:putative CFEM domain protein [Penicillium brasilianum]